ncbi:hypothetical protein ACFQVA_31485 [Actinomadura keratinilytica]
MTARSGACPWTPRSGSAPASADPTRSDHTRGTESPGDEHRREYGSGRLGTRRLRGGPAEPPPAGGPVRAAAPQGPLRPDRRLAERPVHRRGGEPARRRPGRRRRLRPRGTLPRSDLDLLLLHDGSAPAADIARLADRIWYPVWDLGLDLDHSVRTLGEARRTAADDLKAQLGLLDARHLAGDLGTTAALRTTVLADWRNQAPKRLPHLRELCEERAERAGELQYLLEPDLKEARGGLRDATALRAVAASWLADAPREGLDDARRRLLDVRDALHLTTGRSTDRLALQEQDQVAAVLGLLDADTLLRQVYESARTLSYAADVTWREVGRVLRSRSVRPRLRAMLPGKPPSTAARSPRASSSRTARSASPVPPAPNATPSCRCAPPPRPPRPGCRSPCTRCAASPPPPGRCPPRGPPRPATSSSRCSAPGAPPCPSGRRWRPKGSSPGSCPTGNASAAGRSATPSTPGPSTGTWSRPPSAPPP